MLKSKEQKKVSCILLKQKSQGGSVWWALRDYLGPPCCDFALRIVKKEINAPMMTSLNGLLCMGIKIQIIYEAILA